MLEIPSFKIVLFIAVTLCPEDVERISISGTDVAEITLIRKDGGWTEVGGPLWKVVETEMVSVLGKVTTIEDVGRFIDGSIAEWEWKARPSFDNNFLSLRKSDRGFEVSIVAKAAKGGAFEIAFERK